MAWDSFLLLLVGVFATVKISQFSYRQMSLKYLSFSLAALFLTLSQANIWLSSIIRGYDSLVDLPLIIELGSIISLSFLLCGLAVFIRESKPVFAQFPLVYTAAPLILIISYIFVKDSFAIKEWLMSIYQGGALLVALMMYGAHTYRRSFYSYLLGATILYTLSFVSYWLLYDILGSYSWIWQLLFGISIIVTVKGFEKEIQHNADTYN
ncbi:MAG: hypothetical protein U5K69_21975 [Balneolaceae bacterium]|nr:hypothetical protein [Balneolaceae bacterium]